MYNLFKIIFLRIAHMLQFVIFFNTSYVQWGPKMFNIKLCGQKFKHFKQNKFEMTNFVFLYRKVIKMKQDVEPL